MAILRKLVFFILVSFLSTSCIQEYQDLSKGEEYLKQGKYKESISLFSKYDSKRARELNSLAYKNYAVVILSDLNQDKIIRYKKAKPLLRKALDLNPNNQSAKAFYKILSQSLVSEFNEAD